jgi:hypothetical protein
VPNLQFGSLKPGILPNCKFGTPDAGCWMLDAGCWILDAGFCQTVSLALRMLDAGCWILPNCKFGTPDAGCWMKNCALRPAPFFFHRKNPFAKQGDEKETET